MLAIWLDNLNFWNVLAIRCYSIFRQPIFRIEFLLMRVIFRAQLISAGWYWSTWIVRGIDYKIDAWPVYLPMNIEIWNDPFILLFPLFKMPVVPTRSSGISVAVAERKERSRTDLSLLDSARRTEKEEGNVRSTDEKYPRRCLEKMQWWCSTSADLRYSRVGDIAWGS